MALGVHLYDCDLLKPQSAQEEPSKTRTEGWKGRQLGSPRNRLSGSEEMKAEKDKDCCPALV